MKSIRLIISEKGKKISYGDAIVIAVHEDSYDIRTSNGEIFKYIPNTTNQRFRNQDPVSILFSDEDRSDCRIVGKGRKMSEVENIKKVEV